MKYLKILSLILFTFHSMTFSESVEDFWTKKAIANIQNDFGVKVSVYHKNKDLLKYGRNTSVTTTPTTVMTLPSGVSEEVLLVDNLITNLTTDNVANTQLLGIEGQTISDSGFTFVVQSLNANGQTVVNLATPLARVTRLFNKDSVNLLGSVYLSETDTYTGGVPDTDAKIHLMTRSGQNQSEKAATTISRKDYWVITGYHCHVYTKASAFAEVDLQIKRWGGVFRTVDDVSCSSSHLGSVSFRPYVVVPSNSDIRLQATSDAAGGRDVGGSIQGFLLIAVQN